ncbi:MAG: Arc family DNA-binding protein [Desulfuromonadales bacterium]|nr:Arc family DNA-binding protein [Desulfuromonadales bacterium]
MPALTIKNIPDTLYDKLKKTAQSHHRSLNSEIIHCLETVLAPKKIDVSERLQRAHRLRAVIPDGAISAADIDDAINQGRP